MNIYQKLIEVRKEVPYIQKADQGAQYSYTGSSRVLAAVRSKMDELGLLLVPAVTGHNVIESPIEFKDSSGNVTKRTTTYFTELEMTMTWINAEKPDETIERPWYAQGVDIAGEKGVGKALTYGEKYFLLKFFNIATDKDDPDAFQQKHDQGDGTPPPASQKPSQPPQKTADNFAEDSRNADLAAIENESQANRGQPTVEYVSEGQSKMLFAKWKQSEYATLPLKDVAELMSAHLAKNVDDFKHVEKADVNKVIKWLDEHKAAA